MPSTSQKVSPAKRFAGADRFAPVSVLEVAPEQASYDVWQPNGDTQALALMMGLERTGHIYEGQGGTEVYYGINLRGSLPDHSEQILQLSRDYMNARFGSEAISFWREEGTRPHLYADYLRRHVGLRVGNGHYGAHVAVYEWDRKEAFFRLARVYAPDLFTLFLPGGAREA